MVFTPASHSVGAGEDRNAFINHEGGYWMNPVPHGTFQMQSLRTSTKKSDLIDPFGNPKRRDRPDLFGKSRYGSGFSNTQNLSHGADRADGTRGESAEDAEKDFRDSQHDVNGEKNGPASCTDTGMGAQENGNADGISGDVNALQTDGASAPTEGVPASGTFNTNASQLASQKEPFSSEDLIRDKLPLDTANPERRLAHPGNHTERILPTGGSTYNGNLKEEWTAPRSTANTYIRLAPVYESTTHYQFRTGRFYTEDEAPPHELTLPEKTSLITREW